MSLKGRDGRNSYRKIIGSALIVVGVGLICVSQFQVGIPLLDKIAPGGILLVIGSLFWGMITVQNIKDFTGRDK